MNKLFSLTKLQLKDFLSRYQDSLNLKRNSLGKLLMLLLLATLLMPAFQLSTGLYNSFETMGHPEYMLTYVYVSAVFIMFITGLSFIVSIFFYSKDIQFLTTLPVQESTIIFSKLSTIYVYLMGISSLLFLPALVVYAAKSGLTILTVVMGLLALILLPVLPLVISSLIILPLMRVVANSRRRNLFSILAGIGLLVLVIGVQLFIAKQQMNPEYLQNMIAQENGLLRIIGLRFPPSVWLTEMITGSLMSAVYFLGLNALLVLLLRATAKTFYRKALLQFNQEASSVAAGKIYYVKRTKGMQMLRRNMLIIIKQPTFFLNTLVSLLVPLLMFAMMFITGEASLALFRAPQLAPYRGLIFAGILISPAFMANISASAITREGKAFWETKVLPISAAENLRYRVLTTIVINLAGSLLLGVVSLILIPVTFVQFILGVLLCVTLTLFLATIDIVINIKRPLLDWTNPTAAVKNNMNVIFSLVFRLILGGLLYPVIRYLLWGLGLNGISLVLIGLFTALYLVSRSLVYRRFADDFSRIPA